ncbi:protein-export chaperone SecB [Massilia alkalitolerans]|uniref:protein-export chaperone SecB n=1 Tax=Massilia alkalitolerans TaxID=286638 RepID=UPI0009FC4BAA|nr:protein-export chaperone SecB [Massilia alkalitolerans]
MKVSPLQPKGIAFEEISIECARDEHGNPIPAIDFDFQNVRLQCEVGHADYDDDDESEATIGSSMLVSVRLRIENTEGKIAPYKLNVAVSGLFKWLPKDTEFEKRKDLIVVNGATILYGAIREMTLNVTSRSTSGPLLLPAVNFEDNRPSLMAKQ